MLEAKFVHLGKSRRMRSGSGSSATAEVSKVHASFAWAAQAFIRKLRILGLTTADVARA
jgi:hypothetical protein